MKLTKTFFNDIRGLISTARATVARGVDLVQVHTNFEIGRRIVEQEQKGKGRAAYGKEVMTALATRLTKEFGRGYSETNLKLMRLFYLQNEDRIRQTPSDELAAAAKSQSLTGQSQKTQSMVEQSADTPIFQSATGKSQTVSGQLVSAKIAQPLIGQSEILQSLTATLPPDRIRQSATDELPAPRPFTLSWSHYVFLLGVKNPDERSFYEIESAAQNWTVRELKRQFDSSLYERLALSRDKKGIRKLAQEGQVVAHPADLLKEPLVLEFLGLHESHRYSESDLETAILSRLEQFLLELGKGFLFEARQRRFTFDGEHFFVDLVFYNRLLRCYVLIDLKLGRLVHQDLGQMLMYVNTFDRELKLPVENPTIGIILCRQKNKAIVEITLPKGSHIHAHEYQLYLPSKAELQRKLMEWSREAGDE